MGTDNEKEPVVETPAAEDASNAEEEVDDDGNPIPKKKPEPVVVKKVKGPRSASDKDQMIELTSQSELLRGEPFDPNAPLEVKLIATASEGAKEFRLWKLHLETQTLYPYLKIETTITDVIKYLCESSDTQIVAANEKVIKFYDFIDKGNKEVSEKDKKDKAELNKQMTEIFDSVDTAKRAKLDRSAFI